MTTSLPRAMPVRMRQRLVVGAVEVADDEDEPVVGDDARGLRQRAVEQRRGFGHDRRAGGERGVAVGDDGEQAEDGGAAAAGGDRGEAGVGEDEAADAVARPRGCARRRARRSRRRSTDFMLRHGAEEHRLALVDEDQRRAVALLAGDADVRAAGAGGDLPVDGADVVAGEVGADLLELEAAAADPAARRPERALPTGWRGRKSKPRARASSPARWARSDVDARVGRRACRPQATATSLIRSASTASASRPAPRAS